MLRLTPPDRDSLKGTRGLPISFTSPGQPPGEDGIARGQELENQAAHEAAYPDGMGGGDAEPTTDFLSIVRQAESQAQLYTAQVNRRAWAETYRAFHNEHFIGSKYTRPEFRNRSRLFVPKTRTAVRKDMASVAASLFNNIDAVTCLPGDEGDPMQRGAAAVIEELINYRTDRTSGKASIPWFLISLGARQDALLTGICVSKQCWKQDFRKTHEEQVDSRDDDGMPIQAVREHYKLDVDRPDIILFPPENVTIHAGADWTNPEQSAAFIILKYPMTVEEVQAKQNAPVNPWNQLSEAELISASSDSKADMSAIRRAREMGLDRYDETQSGTDFQVVWVFECFMRWGGEDWTFYSVGDQYYLTDPKPVREVYPEQDGERPIAFGYGSLEAHRIFPMSPVESWQPLQRETNDLRNLMLDATKQNVMPVTKVVRGRRVDLDQIKRRSSGSSIFVENKDDVTFETPPQMGQAPVMMGRELDLELDDLAGQQNYGSVETNNALGKTLGGLKLAAGAANAVQEFDIRLWIETWATKALAQIVKAEQYYESDPIVLGICGSRAKLFQKHGISKITDELLEQQVTVRVSVGLGAGDPQQRLAKFQTASQIVMPILEQSPDFQSGQKQINSESIIQEVFGAAGYKDGGDRFFTDNGAPRPNPMADLKTQELQAKIIKDQQTGKGALLTGIANVGKVALGKKELESSVVDMLMGHQGDAQERGFQHAQQHNQTVLAATDHGHRHGMAINEHRRNLSNDALQAQQQQAGEGAELGSAGPSPSPNGAASPAGEPQAPASVPSPPPGAQIHFVRHPHTGRIVSAVVAPHEPQPSPNSAPVAQPKPKAAPPAPQAGAPGAANDERIAVLEGQIGKLVKMLGALVQQ